MQLPEIVDYGPLGTPWWKQWLTVLQRLVNACMGPGQAWQNVAAGRVLGATYTNTTGRPIWVKASVYNESSDYLNVWETVDGVTIGAAVVDTTAGGQYHYTADMIVPPGSSYSVSAYVNRGAYRLARWFELR